MKEGIRISKLSPETLTIPFPVTQANSNQIRPGGEISDGQTLSKQLIGERMDNGPHPNCGSAVTATPNVARHILFWERCSPAADVALEASHVNAGRLKSFEKPNDQPFARSQLLAKRRPE